MSCWVPLAYSINFRYAGLTLHFLVRKEVCCNNAEYSLIYKTNIAVWKVSSDTVSRSPHLPSSALDPTEAHQLYTLPQGDLCGSSAVARIKGVLPSKLAAFQLLAGGKPYQSFSVGGLKLLCDFKESNIQNQTKGGVRTELLTTRF